MIDQQYAEDSSWVTNDEERKDTLNGAVPSILGERNLQANESKTEEYIMTRGGDYSWRKCKYLGSLLDSENDINRRKILSLSACNQLKYIFENKRVSQDVKMRLFNSHLTSIFLYNSELWTVTKQLENTVDVFQRNILRKILDIKWPKKISSEKLYETTKITNWSKTIKKRRLQWYGHLLRLPEETTAKAALREARKYAPKPRGGQKLTWLKLVDKDLENINIKVVV